MSLGDVGLGRRLVTTGLLLLLGACEAMPSAPYTHAVLSSIGGPYDSDDVINVRYWRLRRRLSLPQIQSFAKLSLRQQESLAELTKAWHSPINIYSAGQRALIELAADHPAGPVKILLADDHDELTIFTPDGRQFTEPHYRFADILDCAQDALLHDAQQRQTHLPRMDATAPHVQLQVEFRYRPQRARPQEFRMQLLGSFEPVRHLPVGARDNSVLHAGLPYLPEHQLLQLGRAIGIPARWSSRIINRTLPDTLAANWLNEVDDKRWLPLPARRFARNRPGYRSTRARFRCASRGNQLIARSHLFWLRRGQVSGALEVKNRSGYAAYVYVDGIRMGWVGSGQSFAFTGLPDGYYRIYATSPSGIKSWRPRDTYIPGPFTLH